jgi:hypothetical protein
MRSQIKDAPSCATTQNSLLGANGVRCMWLANCGNSKGQHANGDGCMWLADCGHGKRQHTTTQNICVCCACSPSPRTLSTVANQRSMYLSDGHTTCVATQFLWRCVCVAHNHSHNRPSSLLWSLVGISSQFSVQPQHDHRVHTSKRVPAHTAAVLRRCSTAAINSGHWSGAAAHKRATAP